MCQSDRAIRDLCEPHFQRLTGLVGIHPDDVLLVRACDEIERLRAIVDKLPKTADGVPVLPGMTLWDSVWINKPFVVHSLLVFCPEAARSEWTTNDGEVDPGQCYSTREAAEKVTIVTAPAELIESGQRLTREAAEAAGGE